MTQSAGVAPPTAKTAWTAFRPPDRNGWSFMKRTLFRVLIGLNALVILLLLFLSGALLYLTASRPATLFGYSAVLLLEDKPSLCMVRHHPEELMPTETLLYRSEEEGLLLLTVDRNDGKQVYCLNGEMSISLSDPRLEGQVTSRHPLLGSFFAAMTRPDRLGLSYAAMGIGFLLCLLAVVLIYFLLGRASVPLVESEEDLELLRSLLGAEVTDAALNSTVDELGEEASAPPAGEDYPAPLGSGDKAAGPFPQLSVLRGRRKEDPQPEPPAPEPPAPASPEAGTLVSPESELPEPEPPEEDVQIYTPHGSHAAQIPHISHSQYAPSEPVSKEEPSTDIPELDDLLRQIEDEFKDL